jgi:uncharacterized protein (TIGR03066 family)
MELVMRSRFLVLLLAAAAPAWMAAPASAAETAKDLIVGKWQPTAAGGEKAIIEFTKDGKLKIVADKVSFDGTYKFLKDDQLEITTSIKGQESTVKLTVKVTKDELTTKEEGKNDPPETFKRVK